MKFSTRPLEFKKNSIYSLHFFLSIVVKEYINQNISHSYLYAFMDEPTESNPCIVELYKISKHDSDCLNLPIEDFVLIFKKIKLFFNTMNRFSHSFHYLNLNDEFFSLFCFKNEHSLYDYKNNKKFYKYKTPASKFIKNYSFIQKKDTNKNNDWKIKKGITKDKQKRNQRRSKKWFKTMCNKKMRRINNKLIDSGKSSKCLNKTSEALDYWIYD